MFKPQGEYTFWSLEMDKPKPKSPHDVQQPRLYIYDIIIHFAISPKTDNFMAHSKQSLLIKCYAERLSAEYRCTKM